MTLPGLLREAREDKGLGLRALARRVNVDASYLSRVEAGKVRPSPSLLAALARELKFQEDSLLALGGYMPAGWREAVARFPHRAVLIGEALGQYPHPHTRQEQLGEPLTTYGFRVAPHTNGALYDPLESCFPAGYVPTPELNEIYELKLAMLEARLLTAEELVQRGAYFLCINDEPTYHFRICTGGGVKLPRDSSLRLQSFLRMHQFKTSYATHGLFPYRGKYHPQMIKALLNIMGLRPGCTVLDPMAGSGTTSVEATIMGINSISVDVSPFCAFMTNVKVASLSSDISDLKALSQSHAGMVRAYRMLDIPAGAERVQDHTYKPKSLSRTSFELLALAYMDATGYAARSSRKVAAEFFQDILRKYVSTIERFQKTSTDLRLKLGDTKVIQGDAMALTVPDGSVDGVLFSPPYSFAVDYLENDAPHLKYLGYDPADLRARMVGLNGSPGPRKVTQYFADLGRILQEVSRVLKSAACCGIVVGSNSGQLAKLMGVHPDSAKSRYGIERRLIDLAAAEGLDLNLAARRLIVGIANTMHEEHILIFRKRDPISA